MPIDKSHPSNGADPEIDGRLTRLVRHGQKTEEEVRQPARLEKPDEATRLDPSRDAREIALGAASALLDGKGIDVVILEVKKITLIADYFVIASGSTQRHVRALADRIVETLSEFRKPLHVEGYELGYWTLLDYGDVVIHIFRDPERSFYGLERLWGDAPRVELE